MYYGVYCHLSMLHANPQHIEKCDIVKVLNVAFVLVKAYESLLILSKDIRVAVSYSYICCPEMIPACVYGLQNWIIKIIMNSFQLKTLVFIRACLLIC